MIVVIDRFDGDFVIAIGDDGQKYSLPKTLLKDAREGDAYIIKKDDGETERRKKRAKNLIDELFE